MLSGDVRDSKKRDLLSSGVSERSCLKLEEERDRMKN